MWLMREQKMRSPEVTAYLTPGLFPEQEGGHRSRSGVSKGHGVRVELRERTGTVAMLLNQYKKQSAGDFDYISECYF